MDNKGDSLIIKTKLEPEDLISARKSTKKSSKKSRLLKIVLIGLGIYLAIFIVILAIVFFFGKEVAYYNTVTQESYTENVSEGAPFFLAYLPTLTIIAAIIIFPFIIKKVRRNSAIKHFKSNKLIQKELTYCITNEGVDCSFDSSHTEIKWDEFYKITETNSLFIFFISDLTTWILPKRFFQENEFEKFKILMPSRMQKYKKR